MRWWRWLGVAAALVASAGATCDLDILFVVDASSSVAGTFERTVGLVKAISERLVIGPGAQRVALVEYSGKTRRWVELPFDAVTTNKEWSRRLDDLLYLQVGSQGCLAVLVDSPALFGCLPASVGESLVPFSS